jgi:hypothetical protein
MKKILTAMTILLMAACVFAAGVITPYYYRLWYTQPIEVVIEVPMSIADTQRFLKAQNLYRGRIDSKWGPKTERAWCDYCAVQAIERMKGD